MLLTIEEIRAKLDAEFLPLEPAIQGMRLVANPTTDLLVVERKLGVHLPESFKTIASAYDLGDFTAGPISFGLGENYSERLVRLNTEGLWWGRGSRPDSLIAIAASDPYVFLLDLESGRVSAYDPDESHNKRFDVARDFDLFLRAISTVSVLRLANEDVKSLAQEISKATGSESDRLWVSLVA